MAKKTVKPKSPMFPISVWDKREFLGKLCDRKEARREALQSVIRLLNEQAEEDAEKWRLFWEGIYRDHNIASSVNLILSHQVFEINEVPQEKEEE